MSARKRKPHACRTPRTPLIDHTDIDYAYFVANPHTKYYTRRAIRGELGPAGPLPHGTIVHVYWIADGVRARQFVFPVMEGN